MKSNNDISNQNVFVLFMLTIFFFQQPLRAQQSRMDSIKAGYIGHTDSLLIIKLSANNEYEWFEEKGNGFSYDLRPNIVLGNKVSLNYKFISFSIGFKLPFIPGNEDNEIKGKTKATTFGFGFSGNHLIQELKYFKIKGYYLNNTGDFLKGWDKSSDPYLLLPDTRVTAFQGQTSYKFNPRYSFKAINTQTEMQLKSCGSFVPSLTYNYYIHDNKSSDPSQQSSQQVKSFEAVLSVGYNYTLVLHKKWYVSGGIAPGAGFKRSNLLTRFSYGDTTVKYTDELYKISAKGGLGYNSLRFFAGTEIAYSKYYNHENSTTVKVNTTRVYYQIFIGYKFNVPGYVKRKVAEIENKMPYNK